MSINKLIRNSKMFLTYYFFKKNLYDGVVKLVEVIQIERVGNKISSLEKGILKQFGILLLMKFLSFDN